MLEVAEYKLQMVEVDGRIMEPEAVITIRDNGIGISAEVLPRVF